MNQLNVFVVIKMKKLPIEWIDRIFIRLHGRFGNNFLDKFKTGQHDENGNDLGMYSSQKDLKKHLQK